LSFSCYFKTDLIITSSMPSFLQRSAILTALAAIASSSMASAETINLPWCKPPTPGDYATRTAKEGDTVIFSWAGEAHNVVIYPSGDCLNPKDKTFISEMSGASYTFTADDVGTNTTLVCSISDHCMVGQKVTFEVVPADTADVEYDTSTPGCGDGFLGEPTEPPAPEPSGAASWGMATAVVAGLVGMLV